VPAGRGGLCRGTLLSLAHAEPNIADAGHPTRVASTLSADRELLEAAGYAVEVELSLPGFVRAVVRRGDDATRVDWAHDSAWRLMPLVRDAGGVLLLHRVDLAINKVLALGGRDEARDFVDILYPWTRAAPGRAGLGGRGQGPRSDSVVVVRSPEAEGPQST